MKQSFKPFRRHTATFKFKSSESYNKFIEEPKLQKYLLFSPSVKTKGKLTGSTSNVTPLARHKSRSARCKGKLFGRRLKTN